MATRLPLLALPALALIALFARPPAPARTAGEGPLLPRADLLRVLLPGHRQLVADYYWIQTIHQVGIANTPDEHKAIYPFADLVTDLDPKFEQVYPFAGITIPLHLGREQYANAAESTALLRKGAKNLPGDYKIEFQLAFNLMFFEHAYLEAANILGALAKRPDATRWVGPLATRLYAAAGSFDASEELTKHLYEAAPDEETRKYYARRILEIHQEQMLRYVDKQIEAFKTREHRPPKDLAELVNAHDLPGYPKDPLGGTVFIGPDGRSHATSNKHRLDLIIDTFELERRREELRKEKEGQPLP